MRHLHVVSVVVALLLMILASACGSEPTPEVEDAQQGAVAEVEDARQGAATESEAAADEAVAESEASAEEAAAESESSVAELRELDANNFDDSSTNIDNEWLSLQPGTQWVYEGITVEAGKSIPHRVVFVVTDLTKEIEGVRTVVVWDQDYADGELVETEIAFFAQDKEGTVWHFGQYPEEYEKGKFIDAPTWITGLAGAKAGISMKAEPQPGTPYFQGWGPAVDWTDYAQVDQMGQEICVPADCYEDVLVIAETSLDEPGAFQLKYYARGVGNVQVGWRGDDTTQEELELVEFMQLDPEALAEARAAALELEEHAYEISPGVYAHTAPMEHTLVAEVPVTTASEASSEEAMEATIDSESIEKVFEDFDPNNFGDGSTNIDNEWLPLQPGTQWVFEGFSIEDGESIPHRIEFTVTDLTKEIEGVRTAVAWIVDYSDDELVEAEIAFYAQDNDGNVWYLGEYPAEYEDGEFVDAPTWIAGLEDARAGIKMKAEPQLGTPGYFQGWGPAVEWTDYGQVDQMGQETCVPVDCYQDVLVIAESSLDEPGIFQLKYYAPGVGNIRVGWRGEGESQEELELVEFMQLDPEALAEVRAAALELEKHAYEISPDVYGQTSPAEGP